MKNNQTISALIAEFIGTFALVFFGCGAILFSGTANMGSGQNSMIVPIAFGLTISIMIYSFGHISGAYFNPAVTIGMLLTRNIKFGLAVLYVLVQFVGASAAALALSNFFALRNAGVEVFGNVEPNFRRLDQIATVPTLPVSGAFVLEAILTFFLMIVILSTATDTRSHKPIAGLAIGGTITICAFVGGSLSGASMNPARSIGAALVTGGDALKYAWLYIEAPCLGAILAAIVFHFLKSSEPISVEGITQS